MKIALVLASNTCYAPHMYHYLRTLKEQEIDFDIIIWNKDNTVEKDCISFDEPHNLKKSRFFRIKGYYNYTRFVIRILKDKKYDRVVVFTIFLGILLYPFLKRKYSNNYIFDIRDYSPLLKYLPNIINPLINASFATVISSPGFTKWLNPHHSYLLSHNYHFNNLNLNEKSVNNFKKPYTILTIGFLRDFEANQTIIDNFKNDEQFLLKFVGRGIAYEPLMAYVETNKIENVIFTGAYDKKDENSYLLDAAIVNIFLNEDLNSKTLMTNRFYLAIGSKIPVLVNKNSTQGDYVNQYHLGLSVENSDKIKSDVLDYLNDFDHALFDKGREDFINEIEKDQQKFITKLLNFYK